MKDLFFGLFYSACIGGGLWIGTHLFFGNEQEFSYTVAYETCGGLQDTVEVIGYRNGLEIANFKRAVPELMVKGGKYKNGFSVAYNVCSFNIISKTEIK